MIISYFSKQFTTMIRITVHRCFFIALLGISLCGVSCQSSNPAIKYYWEGGYTGGTFPQVAISPNGAVRVGGGTGQIRHSLTYEEHQSILQLFEGFDTLSHNYTPLKVQCTDQFIFHITLSRDSVEKEVLLDQCVSEDSVKRPAVIRLLEICKTLDKLKKRISSGK
jgi:hypothetical protein